MSFLRYICGNFCRDILWLWQIWPLLTHWKDKNALVVLIISIRLISNAPHSLVSMKSGSLGVFDGDVEAVKSVQYTVEKEGFEATVCLDLKQSITNLEGKTVAIKGIAAEESVVERDSVEIGSDNTISVGTSPTLTWNTTEFLIIPDGLILTDSSSATFLYDILTNEFGFNTNQAQIHLQAFRQELENREDLDVTPWKIGFYGRDGNADNGVVHGVDLLDDNEIGSVLGHNSANQLGLVFDRNSQRMKVFVTESGYIEVYQPSNFDTVDFVNWVVEDIQEHITTDI